MPSGDSLEMLIKVDIPVTQMGTMLCDTLFVETETGTHMVKIYIDSDLISSIADSYINGTSFTNYPNPFTNNTTFIVSLNENVRVTLDILNLAGKKIENVVDKNIGAGEHTFSWSRSDIPAGIYLCRMKAGNDVIVRKLIIYN